jgi:hypothetical protein
MTISTILLHTYSPLYLSFMHETIYVHTHAQHIPYHIPPTERISANVALFDPYLIVIKGWEPNAVSGSGYQRHHTHVHTHTHTWIFT